jgi:hypothetical protein
MDYGKRGKQTLASKSTRSVRVELNFYVLTWLPAYVAGTMTQCYALQANLLTIPVLAVSAFVATRGLIPLWTTSLGLGEVARSTYALLHRLWHEHT